MQFRQSILHALILTGILTLGGTAIACGQNRPVPKPAQPTGKPTPAAPANSGPIALTIKTDKTTYTAEDPINITLTAKNTTKTPAIVQFSDGKKYDIEIHKGKDGNGEKVWQWSQGRMFTMMLVATTLVPDKPIFFTETYNPASKAYNGKSLKLPPGTYTLVGILTTSGRTPRPMASTTIQIK